MTLIEPFGSCGHYPEEMPGIMRANFVATGAKEWRAELFDDREATSMPIAWGDGVNMAMALAVALVDHNLRQAPR
jgi:hypothetical protein